MDIQTDSAALVAVEKQLFAPAQPPWSLSKLQWQELATLLALAVVAFVPRLILATQLDVVTDEIVYILGGKIYVPLLAHLDIGASGWMINYEHPPFVKLLIGTALAFNALAGHPLGGLLTARIPSIISGTLLVVAMYWLGRAPFGRVVALLAALSLAVSPWLVYFSALAYLDMTMTALVTVAFLVLWYTPRHPRLYLLIALLIGLGAASKYTAVLVVPGLFLFTAYYFFVLRFYLPAAQRPRMPWPWWLAAILLSPLCFLLADPAIWPHPVPLLIHSFNFEWEHSVRGHLTFLAGQYSDHVPHWAILYIIFTKISAFITIPAVFFVLFSLVQLVRFHLRRPLTVSEATKLSFLLIWLLSTLGMFSLLNIVVGTHYHLPLASPVAFAGALGLATLLGYRRGLLSLHMRRRDRLSALKDESEPNEPGNKDHISISAAEADEITSPEATPYEAAAQNARVAPDTFHDYKKSTGNWRGALTVALLALCLLGPHLFGLITIPDAEGYASEFFSGENQALQVAYPGYRDALQWIATHTKPTQPRAKIGLVALVNTLNGTDGVSWYSYNQNFVHEFQLTEAHPDDTSYPYDYLVWPMHLVQRGYAIPPFWRSHIVHVVMGGHTTYCYIMARFPSTIISSST
jgi:MFS family permease